MTAKNDVTGDSLISKSSNEKYRSEWDRIFGKSKDAKKNNDKKN